MHHKTQSMNQIISTKLVEKYSEQVPEKHKETELTAFEGMYLQTSADCWHDSWTIMRIKTAIRFDPKQRHLPRYKANENVDLYNKIGIQVLIWWFTFKKHTDNEKQCIHRIIRSEILTPTERTKRLYQLTTEWSANAQIFYKKSTCSSHLTPPLAMQDH